jgi:hypothetical protein
VTLTILVGKEGRTTANFALVQPSIQADLPQVLQAIVEVAGGEVPRLETILPPGQMMREAETAGPDARLRGLIRPIIQQNATNEQIDRAAAALERYVAANEAARRELGRIANTVVSSGRLESYGTQHAQEYLRKWAREFGPAGQDQLDETAPGERDQPNRPNPPTESPTR